MMLSHILRAFTEDSAADEALLAMGDLVLIASVEQESAFHGEARGEYVSGAVRRFARMAGDEDWLAVMNTLERSDKPAEDFLPPDTWLGPEARPRGAHGPTRRAFRLHLWRQSRPWPRP